MVPIIATKRFLPKLTNFMKHTFLRSLSSVSGILLASLATVPAAQIFWQNSVDMYQGASTEDFVNTNGTAVIAVNPSNATNGDADITLNGVSFIGANQTQL